MAVETLRRLTDQEVNAILTTYQRTGRPELRDQIVLQFTNLVEGIARRFAGTAEPTEDLVQEGYIGLISAVDGYRADKGVKFSTYATHFIIGQIKHYLRDKGKIIKEPAWLQELNQKVARVVENLTHATGQPPSHAEIAAALGMKEETISDLLTTREVFKVSSLDGGSEQDEGGAYDIERVRTDVRSEYQIPVEERLVLDTAVQKLKELEQAVIHEFYYSGKNQTEIARGLGISCNYVSHILRNSTKKLKKILTTEELKESQRELALIRRRMDEAPHWMEDGNVVDSITRLYNRRYFNSRLEEELIRASREGHPVAVVLIELDGYDRVQPAYGLDRAEELIRQAAELIRGNVRRADIVTRFDTQSFALILPHTGPQAEVVVTRLERALTEWLAGQKLARSPIRFRMSHAHCVPNGCTAAELVESAQELLSPARVELAVVA